MLLFIYLRWGRKFGGIWVIDSSEMKENAAVVRKQLQNSSENTNNHEYNQSKLRIVLLSYLRLLQFESDRPVHCNLGSLEVTVKPARPTGRGSNEDNRYTSRNLYNPFNPYQQNVFSMAHVSIGSTLGYLNEQKQTRNPFKNKKKISKF